MRFPVTIGRAEVEDLFPSGCIVTLTTTGTLPGGLATATNYYVGTTGTNTIKLYANASDYTNLANAVTLTSDGTGTHTVQRTLGAGTPCSYYGLNGRIMRVSQMPGHTHDYSSYTVNFRNVKTVGGADCMEHTPASPPTLTSTSTGGNGS